MQAQTVKAAQPAVAEDTPLTAEQWPDNLQAIGGKYRRGETTVQTKLRRKQLLGEIIALEEVKVQMAFKAQPQLCVRLHRACSWIQRAEKVEDDDLDFALLCYWTAFNAIYGQWDMAIQEPLADWECWQCFLDRMVALDGTTSSD